MTHDPISPDDWALVRRHLVGDASPDESVRAEAILARDPRLATLRGALRVTTPSADVPLVDTVALKQRIDAQRRSVESTAARPSITATRSARWLGRRSAIADTTGTTHRRVSGIAVMAAAFAAVVAIVAVRYTATTPVSYEHYTTRDAQIAHLTLDDGTRVTLAPHTTLRVARNFASHRDLLLNGEAYFDVAHASGVPFLVHTGAVTTRVLGTAFDVRRYPTDQSTRVVVMSGKVAVAGQQGVTLAHGGVGHVTDSTATAATVQDAVSYGSWTSGALAFREVPAADMLETVGRWYDLRFQFADSTLARKRLVATFATGETRADALELISTILDATLTFTEAHDGQIIVTLHPKTTRRESATPMRRFGRDSLTLTSVEVGR